MSYADKERYENEERPEVQRQILAEIARKLPVYTRTGNGGVRFCDRCQLIKPDRCHHCSVCAICVLKMDHHCPWVNNCIGFSNYKFFLLFLAYSLLYCLYIAATVFKYFIKYWTGELTNGRSKFHVLFLLFVAVMFFVTWRQGPARGGGGAPRRMEAMPCQNQRLGPRPQDEQPAATATAGGGSRLIRFAEPGEDSGCPSPDSSSNGVAAAPMPAGEGGAPPIGPQLKLLPMNDQLRELQTIIRDK
ncbi:palmitoyltransferase ZDHHC15-like [Spheniscus humboldti]